ncbi:hypothetical protein [Sulfuricurvum sp.]|uniref:hypothetical protein n=1 Tax=Sulfuricurvum sp. TaxID=2025608 RepID=UPI0026342CAF|nr:hypothetical protein [Sulfuricurvum sp.]MDD2780858.1 hypothetical protein [Sulfuricurvum sp.]
MNIKKVIKYTIVAIPLLFLAKWGIEKIIYDSNKIPDINLHPKEKVRIYGKFPLDTKSYYIKASVRYIATNPKCDNVVWLAGARFAQDENVDMNATMLDNHYEINIYNDYYQYGVCDWQIGEIGIVTIHKDTNRASYGVGFSTKKSGTHAFDFKSELIRARSPLNFICNYEHHDSSDYTHYFCEDSTQKIVGSIEQNIVGSTEKAIFFPNSQKEFEVNFQQMAEPMKQPLQGEK